MADQTRSAGPSLAGRHAAWEAELGSPTSRYLPQHRAVPRVDG